MLSNSNSHITLQTTKLSTVVDLAEFIAYGILQVIEKGQNQRFTLTGITNI